MATNFCRLSGSLQLDAGMITDEHISGSTRIAVTKSEHAYLQGTGFGLAIGGTPATREDIVHVANVAGTIRGFHCLLNDTGTTTSIAFDLKKNGTTVLSSTVSITHSDVDRVVKDGSVSTTSFAAGDVLSIAMTVTSATGAQGPFAWVAISEQSAP